MNTLLSGTAAMFATVAVLACPQSAHARPADAPSSSSTAGTATHTASARVPGQGWYLTEVDHGKKGDYGIVPTIQRIVLVDPQGHRRTILERRVPRRGLQYFQLADWSADGGSVLVSLTGGKAQDRAWVIDVQTGETRTVALGTHVQNLVFDAADTGLLANGYSHVENDQTYPIYHFDLDGHRTTVGRTSAPIIAGPDDEVLTAGRTFQDKVFRVLDGATGEVLATVPTPGRYCQPVRWWNASSVLVTCSARTSMRMALIDPAAGTVRMLTARHPRGSIDLGDFDARATSTGLYLQASGPCGVTFVAKALPDGGVREIKIPGALGNVVMVDTTPTQLVVQHAADCDGGFPRSTLARVTPRTGREHVITALPAHEAFGRVLAFGETRATMF